MPSQISRIAIPVRMMVKSWQPRIPGHVDISAIRWKWYWKSLWWFLRKLGARYNEEIPECWPVQVREINHADIISMLETGGKAMRELWNLKAAILVLGPDEYSKLMRDTPQEMVEFEMPVPMARTESEREKWAIEPRRTIQTRTCKLRVICVPWLEGWALLPDLDRLRMDDGS